MTPEELDIIRNMLRHAVHGAAPKERRKARMTLDKHLPEVLTAYDEQAREIERLREKIDELEPLAEIGRDIERLKEDLKRQPGPITMKQSVRWLAKE